MERKSLLQANTTIITRTDVHSRDLLLRHGKEQKAAGLTIWDKPDIQPFRQWVTEAWLASWPTEQLLHPVQELFLYQSIISASEAGEALLSSTSIARLARHGDSLLREYGLCLEDDNFKASTETLAFREWATTAADKLKNMGWITFASMVDAFISQVESGAWAAPDRLIFSGFISLPPQIQRLIQALESGGSEVIIETAGSSEGEIKMQRYDDPRQELRAVAFAIRAQLEDFIDQPAQAPRIAVLVPNMDNYRIEIERIFTEIISPEYLFPNDGVKHIPWRYGTGQALSEHELISLALDVLDLNMQANNIDLITRILLNTRFSNTQERQERAMLDIRLRETSGPSLALPYLLNVVNKHSTGAFAQSLQCLIKALEDQTGKHLPSTWAAHFRQRLECLGWPGAGSLSSDTYQALTAWHESLAEFSSMDRQSGTINGELALTVLREILASRPFQAKVSYYQPIQILNHDDAPGLYFDHAFVLGLSSGHLPRAASPNPLIPLAMQRDAGVPLATPEQALGHAEQLLCYLRGIAANIICSCPLMNDAGGIVNPSPLLSGWPDSAAHDPQEESIVEQVLALGKRTTVPDSDPVPPVQSALDEGIQGGVAILQQFAENPFIAFCRARLGLRPFPIPRSGLDKATQGTLTHRLLEGFWAGVNTSDALQSMDDDALHNRLDLCLEKLCTDGGELAIWRYGTRLVQLEKTRLKALLHQWLRYEQDRSDAFTVIARELRVEGNIGELQLKLQLDRIDEIELEDGSKRYLIIDYKTGSVVNKAGWSLESLTEPQLPIYATIDGLKNKLDKPVDGIAFAHVATGNFNWHLQGNWTKQLNNNTHEDHDQEWQDMRKHWQAALGENARLFLQGVASVDPDGLRKSFYHADLAVLVRDDA